jgi:hypothetical protein
LNGDRRQLNRDGARLETWSIKSADNAFIESFNGGFGAKRPNAR